MNICKAREGDDFLASDKNGRILGLGLTNGSFGAGKKERKSSNPKQSEESGLTRVSEWLIHSSLSWK
uniref:Uncharacterized protein n=1 Tax=Utricularia reniformis TaxID=192314 RepID=A0A1Y0B0N7_9LAMI|nr:hypothetical protein AEK19_MT0690 [Utricularia reniformis]ART30938.1 hypothetical protein AEK19_MT0690 [Utricularia reniformis]